MLARRLQLMATQWAQVCPLLSLPSHPPPGLLGLRATRKRAPASHPGTLPCLTLPVAFSSPCNDLTRLPVVAQHQLLQDRHPSVSRLCPPHWNSPGPLGTRHLNMPAATCGSCHHIAEVMWGPQQGAGTPMSLLLLDPNEKEHPSWTLQGPALDPGGKTLSVCLSVCFSLSLSLSLSFTHTQGLTAVLSLCPQFPSMA